MSLSILLSVSVFLLGMIVGSFLNVIILRHGTSRSFLSGRSVCYTCGKVIRWLENIPVLSYLWLRGKCSSCKAALSVQYPLVEFVTGILFLAIWLSFTANYQLPATSYPTLLIDVIAPTLFYFAAFSLLIVIFVYDLYHKIIPDTFSYLFAGLALVGLIVSGVYGGFDVAFWTDLAAGPILFLPFWALWYFSGGTWMGFGDGKLALGIGWMLGLVYGISAIVLAFWIGAVVAVILLALQRMGTVKLPFSNKELTMKSEVPFGPFLVLGTLIVYFFPINFFPLGI